MPAFVASLLTLLWTYLVFPVVTLVRAVSVPRRIAASATPLRLDVVIAAHNEASVIGAKLESVLACDYDPALLRIIVAADGCTDGTEDVVRGFADRGVTLLALGRVGKATALNEAIAQCTGDVLVLSDANGLLDTGALLALAAPFADPAIGGVAGDQRYLTSDDDDAISEGERSYWSLDRVLKVAESRSGNVISATGGLYAIRRALAETVPDGVTDDFFLSTGVIAQGSRLVFSPDAIVYEHVAASGKAEFGRKVRIMSRGLNGVLVRRRLLDPRRHGFYAVQLLSHKVLRRLMVVPLAGLLVSSTALARRSRWLALAAAAQHLFYIAGAIGVLLSRRPSGARARSQSRIAKLSSRVVSLPAFFCLVNVAAVRAVWNVATGTRIDRWETTRGGGPS